MVAEILVPKRN